MKVGLLQHKINSKIASSFFLKASIGSLFSTFTRMVCRFAINKIYAVLLGPAGIALVGQFQDLITTTQTFTSAGIKDGINRNLAFNKDKCERINFLSSSLKLLFLIATFAAFVLILFSQSIDEKLFNGVFNANLIIFLALSLFILNLVPFYEGVCNGLKDVKSFGFLEVLNGGMSLVLAAISTYYWGILGALVAIVVSQIILVVIYSFIFRKKVSLKAVILNKTFKSDHLAKHKKFIGIAILSGCIMPIIQIAIRNHIISHIGFSEAGYWEAMKRLGNLYFPIFVSFGSVYFFPRFSEISDSKSLMHELKQKLSVVVASLSLIFVVLYIFREVVVTLIFSKEFLPITDLFIPFFIGDIFNVVSFVFLTLMISREKIMDVILCRGLVGCVCFLCVVLFIDKLKLRGVVYSYAISYVINFVYCLFFIYREFVKK